MRGHQCTTMMRRLQITPPPQTSTILLTMTAPQCGHPVQHPARRPSSTERPSSTSKPYSTGDVGGEENGYVCKLLLYSYFHSQLTPSSPFFRSGYYIIFIIIIVVVALMSVYENKIIGWLQPAAQWMKGYVHSRRPHDLTVS